MAETHIFYGEDDFSLREAFREIRLTIPIELWESNVITLEGTTLTPAGLLGAGGVFPFLAPRRLVAVEGFLARFEPPDSRQRRRTPSREPKVPSEWLSLPDLFKQMPDSTLLLFLEGKLSWGNPMLAMLKPVAAVREFPLLRGARLSRWIQDKAREKGATLSPAAVSLLASLVGSNLWIMSQEVEKLAAYAEGRRVEEDDVRRLVAQSREANVFEMVDAALEGNRTRAMPLMKRLLDAGESPQGILSLLAGQIRLLIQIRALQIEGEPPEKIGSRLGITSEFRLTKALEQARKLPMSRLEAAYARVLEADLQIKRGALPEDIALYLLLGLI